MIEQIDGERFYCHECNTLFDDLSWANDHEVMCKQPIFQYGKGGIIGVKVHGTFYEPYDPSVISITDK